MKLPSQDFFSISEAAQKLGVSISTLRRWEREGKISVGRTPGGKRLFSKEDLQLLISPIKVQVEQKKHFKIPSFKPKLNWTFFLFVLVIIFGINTLLYSPYSHQAVLGVETFVAPVVEEVSPIFSPITRFLSQIGTFFRNSAGAFILALLPEGSLQNVQTPTQTINTPSPSPSFTIPDNLTLSYLSVSGNVDIRSSITSVKNITATGDISGGTITGTKLKTTGDLQVDKNITLTGVINSNTFNSSTLAFAGPSPSIYPGTTNTSISLNGNGTGGVNLQSGSTGDINFYTTANKITSAGNLTIGGVYNVGGSAGQTKSACGSSQYLGGMAVTGGIITSLGNCTTVSSSTPWSSITDPSANLSLSMAAFTTTFTWNAATGAGTNLFTLQDTTGNTGTGYLLTVANVGTSTLKPFRIQSQGTTILDTTATGVISLGTNLLFSTDNTNDIGASGATRPRDIYLARNFYLGTGTAPAAGDARFGLNGTQTAWATAIGLRTGLGINGYYGLATYDGATEVGRVGFGFLTGPGYVYSIFGPGDTTERYRFTNTALLFPVDNTQDIGASGATRPRNIYPGTQIKGIDGTVSLPVYAFGTSTTTGLYSSKDSAIHFAAGGVTAPFYVTATGFAGQVRGPDGTAAAPAFTFNTSTSTGIFTSNDSTLRFSTGGTERFRMDGTGLLASTDNSYDIGASAANRPRTGYFGTSIVNAVGSASAPSYTFTGNTNTGMFQGGASILAFAAGGAQMFYLQGNGLFGGDAVLDSGGAHVRPFVGGAGSGIAFSDNRTFAIFQQTYAQRTTTTFGTEYIRFTPTGTTVQFPSITTTASAANAFLDGSSLNNLLRSTSSLRYKNLLGNLSLSDAQNIVLNAQPIVYTSKSKADNPNTVYVGFAAEQIATIDTGFITYDEKGLPNWVQYPVLTAPLTLIAQNHEGRLVDLETSNKKLLATVGLPTPTPSSSPSPTPSPTPPPAGGSSPLPNSILSRLDTLEKSVLASSSASFDNLTVLKKLLTADLGITGSISSGLLSIKGLDSSVGSGSATINTLSSDLYLQNLGVGGVNILAGKVTIDKNGNVKVKKLNVDESEISSASIGRTTIPAGTTSLNVSTTAVTASSKIFVTLKTKTGKQPLIVNSQTAGTNFTVTLEESYPSDITFDWWVVN